MQRWLRSWGVGLGLVAGVTLPLACEGGKASVSDAGASIDAATIDGPVFTSFHDSSGQRCAFGVSFDGNEKRACEGTVRTVSGRPVCLKVPSNRDPSRPMPLVLLLHGYGVDGQVQSNYFDFDALAEREGFLLAKPDGTAGALGIRYWNASKACCAPDRGPAPDDVVFLSEVIQDAKSAYTIDPRRIYVVGHSNGAFMAHRFACERAELLAAVVSLAGAVDPLPCAPKRPVSILQVHGTRDTLVAPDGGLIFGNTAPYPSVHTTLATWATKNGCTGARAVTRSLDLVCNEELGVSETEEELTAGCPAGVDVALWRMADTGHIPQFRLPAWPDTVWDFLKGHVAPE